jgi:putative effector of murein hydrolase LrgA (UPF0299 family)
MWLLIWLKFLVIAMVTFGAIIGTAIAVFYCGLWLDRKLGLRVPGVVAALWLFYTLYFSVLWTCQELWAQTGRR